MVLRIEAVGVFFRCRRVVFWSGFRLDQGKTQLFESCTLCLNVSSFLKLQTCGPNRSELERICAQSQPLWGGNCGIFSIVSFLPSVLACMVDVVPDVIFWRSWCRWKACATFSLKVLDLQKVKLGLERYDPANRGYWSVFPCWGVIFWLRFQLDRRSSWRSESYTL